MFRRSRTLRIFEKLKLKGKKRNNRRYFSSGNRTNRRNSCASNVLSVLTREFNESLRTDEYQDRDSGFEYSPRNILKMENMKRKSRCVENVAVMHYNNMTIPIMYYTMICEMGQRERSGQCGIIAS